VSCLPHQHKSRFRQGYGSRHPPLSLSHHVASNVIPARMRHYPGDLKHTVSLRRTRICLGVPVKHSPEAHQVAKHYGVLTTPISIND